MEFFKKYFSDMHELDNGEYAVLCPFPHTDEQGNQYYESVPSAHISEAKSLFHCKVCGRGLSEAAFIKDLQGISYRDALVLLETMQTNKEDDFTVNQENFRKSADIKKMWASLALDMETAQELRIGSDGQAIEFPVFVYGELLDVRNYVPGRKPAKVKSRKGAKCLILPFDKWREDERPTLLCAGEKDMAMARQNGFNAITFTGGEQAFPKLFKASFRDRQIYIVYDNDQAGKEGSRKIASLLKECGARPHVVTKHYEVCKEKGEDLHDFFVRYTRTREDLQKMLDETPEFSEEDHQEEQQRRIPHITIEESSKGQYADRLVSSQVSVVATYEEMYRVPEYAELTKFELSEGKNHMNVGDTKVWSLDEKNVKDILLLMDSGLRKEQVKTNLKTLAGVPPKESFVSEQIKSKMNVFKAVVTDDLEKSVTNPEDERQSMKELLVYSIGKPLEGGGKYKIFYKPVEHPLKGQQVVGIVTKSEEADNSMTKFKVNESVLDSLKCFQVAEGQSVKDKMDELYERTKGFAGVEARKEIVFATDLFYHTPLYFKFGRRTEKAILDAMIIGAERTGKSQTAKSMIEMYELGLIASLKTTTRAGLIGGSDQTSSGWKTKLGIIPRNHKGALILEEFSGGGQELISKLTEIRSSGMARISRVNGSTTAPALVRMLSISNPQRQSSGVTLPIKNYPSGIQVILDLIGASEDIARYDFFLLVDSVEKYTSPLDDFDLEPFPKESYMNRVRWVWSRKAEQIVIDRPVANHIVHVADELNEEYDSHIKLFGPEAWKKLARVAIATAGLLASMDETGQKIIVTKEHVDWAKYFLIACYDNKTFKLKQYVQAQRRLVHADEAAVHALQGLYSQHAVMLQQLEMSTEISQRDLQMISGLDPKEFPKVLNLLTKFNFVQFPNSKVVPTTRFREAMNEINRDTYMKQVGEW